MAAAVPGCRPGLRPRLRARIFACYLQHFGPGERSRLRVASLRADLTAIYNNSGPSEILQDTPRDPPRDPSGDSLGDLGAPECSSRQIPNLDPHHNESNIGSYVLDFPQQEKIRSAKTFELPSTVNEDTHINHKHNVIDR